MKSCLRQWYHLSYSVHFPVSYPLAKKPFLDSMKTVKKRKKYTDTFVITKKHMGPDVYQYGLWSRYQSRLSLSHMFKFSSWQEFSRIFLSLPGRTADHQAMKTTKRRKKKMRTAKIFTMSQRLEVTDWKYLNHDNVRLLCWSPLFIKT